MKVPSYDNIEFFDTLSINNRKIIRTQVFALFPEVLNSMYKNAVLWLLMEKGIVSYNFRDMFSAGGQKERIINGHVIKTKAVLNKLETHINQVVKFLKNPQNLDEIRKIWDIEDLNIGDTLYIWKKLVEKNIKNDFLSSPVNAIDYIQTILQ